MRAFKNIVVMAAAFICCLSCGEDEPVYTDKQAPVFELAFSIDKSDTITDLSIQHEFGTVLEFLEDGRISELCARIPLAGVYRVTLWDADEKEMITSVSIELEAEIPACADIPEHLVGLGERITVSVLTNSYYEYSDLENPGIPLFPVTVGAVELQYFTFAVNPSGLEYPDDGFIHGFLYGLADVIYERAK